MPTAKLTARTVEAAKPGAKPYTIWDTEVPGFGLRVPARIAKTDKTPGEAAKPIRKTFVFRYRQGGRGSSAQQVKIDNYGALTVEQARDKAIALRGKVRGDGADPAGERRKAREVARSSGQPVTVAELITEYLDRWAKPKKRTASADERALNADVLPAWGKRPAREITRRDVVELLDRVVDRGAPIMANRVLAVVRRMFNLAIERGILDASPCVKVKPPGQETARARNLTGEEIMIFWRALDRAHTEPGIVRALRFMLATGQRRGEVAGMTAAEVNPMEKTWLIPVERSKNGKPHLVPLSPVALAILAETTPGEAGYYFPSPRTQRDGLPYDGKSIDHACRDLFKQRQRRKGVKAAPLPILDGVMPAFTPHDLRRSMSTRLRELGVSRDDVGLLLNHAKGGVTGKHYDVWHGLPEKRRAVAIWGAYLESLLTGAPGNVVELRPAAASA